MIPPRAALAVRAPEPIRSDDDDAPMRRLADGDLSALGVLYERHAERVRRFVFRAAGSNADVDDLTQETFLTLSKIASRYDGRGSVRPFLLGIAAQLVRARRRRVASWVN